MAIVTSEIIENSLQVNDIRRITERHIDHVGIEYRFTYCIRNGINLRARMEARVASIEEQIKEREIDNAVRLIAHDKRVILNWATWQEVRPYLQRREGEDTIKINSITDERTNIEEKITEIDGGK